MADLKQFAVGLAASIRNKYDPLLSKINERLNVHRGELETLRNQIAILRADVAKVRAAKPIKPKERSR